MKIYSNRELTAIFREIAGPEKPQLYTATSLVITPDPVIWTIGPIDVPLRGPVDCSPAPVRPPRPRVAPSNISLITMAGMRWKEILQDITGGDPLLMELVSREATFGLQYGATMRL